MRIALVCPYDLDVPGGVQRHVEALAGALREAGDDVTVLAAGRGRLGRAVPVPANGSRAPIALDPRVLRRTRRALSAEAPDVVHVHEPAVPLIGLAAARTTVAPVVATHHAWSSRSGVYGVLGPALRSATDGVAARIAVSAAARAHHATALGVPASAFTVIGNGVDVRAFADAPPLETLRGEPPVLLFVGRLERRKGLEILLRAFPRIKTVHPDARLVVAGEGPERDRCQRLLPAALRVDVDFLGRVSEDDKRRLYASADVFVAPALGGESFGIVLLEALAAGAAVVASDLPGFREVVRHGVTARMVPPGDPAALADEVVGLLSAPRLAAAQVDAGRDAVLAHDWARVADAVRGVYLRVLNGQGPSRQ